MAVGGLYNRYYHNDIKMLLGLTVELITFSKGPFNKCYEP